MKAYLCSIGEKTTELCQEQLAKFGYEVILLGDKEPWYEKYKKFVFMADEDCIRIDADVIPNKNIVHLDDFACNMVQGQTYDFYKNGVGVTSPVLYRKEALEIIKKNWHLVGKNRPETDASRIPEVNKSFHTCDWVVGIHGFLQNREDLERHWGNKIARGQIKDYDFELATKLQNL
jgi:hypothetical protein